ncbi:MAG: STAS domain-containing protein [Hyphomicrobiales bacterium]|nr:STAS domain-containing protein [Hyphomicrobiales bacterium]
MQFSINKEASNLTFKITGKFTFADHERFKEMLKLLQKESYTGVTINMEDVDFIDSSAMGMLLIAREEAQKRDVKIVLLRPRESIQKMFKVAKFDTLFSIHS